MAFIIGRCHHGVIVTGAIESVSEETLIAMATSYDLERVDALTFDGECKPCRERYVANMKLLGLEP